MLRMILGERAMLLSNSTARALLVSDLHLGVEKELSLKGVNIPRQTKRILGRLVKLVRRYQPDRLIFLGDVKHGISKISFAEWSEVPQFFEELLDVVKKIDVVPGNHDGDLMALIPHRVRLVPIGGMLLQDGRSKVWLTHGHAWPAPEAFSSDTIIMGHHHFTVQMNDRSGFRRVEPVWVVASCEIEKVISHYMKSRRVTSDGPLEWFKKEFGFAPKQSRIIIMPAFNTVVGGMPINRQDGGDYLGPIFRSGGVQLTDSELYLLDGTYLSFPSMPRT